MSWLALTLRTASLSLFRFGYSAWAAPRFLAEKWVGETLPVAIDELIISTDCCLNLRFALFVEYGDWASFFWAGWLLFVIYLSYLWPSLDYLGLIREWCAVEFSLVQGFDMIGFCFDVWDLVILLIGVIFVINLIASLPPLLPLRSLTLDV